MSIRIEEVFEIAAHPDRVWSYLTDPREVVHCLPGAELTSVEDERTFLGRVKVKVGPITTAYAGKVVLTERDDANRVVKMTGEGRESGGSGSAKMTMTSSVVGSPTGGSEVRVTAEIDIVGRVAQFGRGMIESVNKQMFKQFTECVRTTLATATTTASPSTSDVPPPPPTDATPPPAWMNASVATPTSGSVVRASMASGSSAPVSPPTVAAQPVKLLPVFFRALGDYLGSLFARLFGRSKRS